MYTQNSGGFKMLTLQIKRWGNSAAIRIPNSVLQQLAWSEGETLQAQVIDRKFIINKASSSVEIENELYQKIADAGVDVGELVNRVLTNAARTIETTKDEPAFTLEQLMKGYPDEIAELSDEDKSWLNMKPVGKESL